MTSKVKEELLSVLNLMIEDLNTDKINLFMVDLTTLNSLAREGIFK